jgi:hypothetical protein
MVNSSAISNKLLYDFYVPALAGQVQRSRLHITLMVKRCQAIN